MTGPGQQTRHGQTPMFSGPLHFCSNFDETAFWLPVVDAEVPSGEHGFNALKFTDSGYRAEILAAPSPQDAKALGRTQTVPIRPGWDQGLRVLMMQKVQVAKFAVPSLAERLVATGAQPLTETNYWHDLFWGSCFCPRHAHTPGVNMLGELLMALRARIQMEMAA